MEPGQGQEITFVGQGCSQMFSLGPDLSVTLMTYNNPAPTGHNQCHVPKTMTAFGLESTGNVVTDSHKLQSRCGALSDKEAQYPNHAYFGYWVLVCDRDSCQTHSLDASFSDNAPFDVYKNQAVMCQGHKAYFYSWVTANRGIGNAPQSTPSMRMDVFDFSKFNGDKAAAR